MQSKMKAIGWLSALALALLFAGSDAQAAISGSSGSTGGCAADRCFSLEAHAFDVPTPDGATLHMWGYSEAGGSSAGQYPGPTLFASEGETIEVTLTNSLPEDTSIVFPGQTLISEAAGGPGVTIYTVGPLSPGTYAYHSGTRSDLQTEMGLGGVLIVRPSDFSAAAPTAYGAGTDTAYDREYLFVLSEADIAIHQAVQAGDYATAGTTGRKSVFWFINGRLGPDTMAADTSESVALAIQYPHQPYSSLARMYPGEKILMRVVNTGRELHPFHHHGAHALLVARDGRVLSTGATSGGRKIADLAVPNFTVMSIPGGTGDAIYTWEADHLDWDIYGHARDEACGAGGATTELCPTLDYVPAAGEKIKFRVNGAGNGVIRRAVGESWSAAWDAPGTTIFVSGTSLNDGEYTIKKVAGNPRNLILDAKISRAGDTAVPVGPPDVATFENVMGADVFIRDVNSDHGKPLPTLLPDLLDSAIGGFYGGSPFLGELAALPPGEGGLSLFGGLYFMWHSHTEKELANFDIFPGGMMTMAVVEHPSCDDEGSPCLEALPEPAIAP